MSATAETPAGPQPNFRVTGPSSGFQFGKFPRGTVLPRWAVERAGRTAEEGVSLGHFEPTFDPVVIDLRTELPAPTRTDPEPEREAELARLRAEVANLRADNRAATGAAADFRGQVDRLTPELGRQTAEITRLRGLFDATAAELGALKKNAADVDWLNATLDTLTAPPPRQKKPAAAAA